MLQGWPQQMDFAYAGPAGQELDERTQGPALPRKLAIQRGEAGGNDGALRAGKLGSPPQGWMNVFRALRRKTRHGGMCQMFDTV